MLIYSPSSLSLPFIHVDYELERGDYDIVSIDNTRQPSNDVIIVHNAGMHSDMKTMMMKHIRYPVTAAFDEHCCDDDTYKHVAKPLVLDAVMNGGVSTILMFGQTGAGKSFTMTGKSVFVSFCRVIVCLNMKSR